MYRCPVCGDFDDDKDWCNHCQVPMKEEINTTSVLTLEEQAYAEHYYSELLEIYIRELEESSKDIDKE